MRIFSPQIGYYYRASPAKDFGKGFNKYFEHTLLVVADPVQGCSEFVNTHKIPGNFILVERGECSFVEKVCYTYRTCDTSTQPNSLSCQELDT